MNSSKAWIALTAASLALAVSTGCKKDPEQVSAVPPPPPTFEPQPLPPVEVQPGSMAGDNGEFAEPEPPSPAPSGVVAPAGNQQTYTIRKGDTLWAIATRVYGNGQRWVDIAQANPSVDPMKMVIGQQIILP